MVSIAHHITDTSLMTFAVALATFAVLISMERKWAHSPAPLVAVGGAIAASWYFGLQAAGVATVGLDSARTPFAHTPGSYIDSRTSSRRIRYCANEFYRNHRRG